MTFPAPAPANLENIHEQDVLRFRPDGHGRWGRSSPVGVIDQYYGGRTGEVAHLDDFGMRPQTRITGHWSVQPDTLSHIRFNVDVLGPGWLDPTSSTHFGDDSAFMRCADASWRKADFSNGNPNNSMGYVLNWANGDDWAIKARTSAQVRFDFIKLNPNYTAFRWGLLFMSKAGKVTTLEGMLTLQAIFEDMRTIAFNCDANVVAGTVHLEGF